jgi:cytochrome b6
VSDHRRLSVAAGVAIGVLAGEVLALAATGVWLTFNYRPQASDAFPELAPPTGDLVVQDVHRWLAVALIPTVVAALGLVATLLLRQAPRWRWRHVLLPIALVAALVASFTGFALPWDQLALESVTVGRRVAGYDWIWRAEPGVRFVIVDGLQVSTGTMAALFVVHLAVTAVLVVALGVLAVQPRRSAGGGPNRPST